MTNTSTRSSDHSVPDQQVLGIVLILASNVIMALGDALIKYVSADLTIWQIFVVRSVFALCCLGAFAYWNRGPVAPRHYGWVLLRSLFLVLTWLSFYASLPVLNLSLAAVVIYTNVIFTTLLSAMLFKERVSVKQWLGVLSGFVGVAIILRPGTDSFSWFVLMPLAGALCYSLASLVTRHKCQGERALTLAASLHVSFIFIGGLATVLIAGIGVTDTIRDFSYFLFGNWTPLTLNAWAIMALLGLLSASFSLGVARAYQVAPSQIIATFDYNYLVFAAVWGFLFFAEIPSITTLIGMAVITFAGVLVSGRTRPRA
jgi:drug/metabolite transporter (DMT)-like permease